MKTAYPNSNDYPSSLPTYDLGKWMETMKQAYIKMHLGLPRKEALDNLLNNWDISEKTSFLDWLRYYEGGNQHKYNIKTAQQHNYYVNDALPNYFIPNPKNMIPSPIKSMNDQINEVPQEAAKEVKKESDAEEKRRVIEDQRRKLMGRLNSAEKLLISQRGHLFAGVEFEKLLSAIFELKRQIQTANKVSNASMQTCIDLIVRQGNKLNKQGYEDAGSFFVKFAQETPGDFSLAVNQVIPSGSANDGKGSVGNNDLSLSNLSATPPEKMDEDAPKDGLNGFLERLENSGLTSENDTNDNKDEVSIDDDVFLDQEVIPDENELVVEAQAIPDAENAVKAPAPTLREQQAVKPKENLEVEVPGGEITQDEVRKVPSVSENKSNVDNLIDSVFSKLTVNDVIEKLENINKVYSSRELSRQLTIVDIMLARLNLSSYFNNLAESITKSYESNSYILNRIQDVLATLRGAVGKTDIDLENENTSVQSPEVEKVRQNLDQAEKKERERKELRKQLENQKNEQAVKPEPTVENVKEELAAPTEEQVPAKLPPQKPIG